MAARPYKFRSTNSVFTQDETKRFWRRAQIHLEKNNGDLLIALASEVSREIEMRLKDDDGETPLRDLVSHSQVADALEVRGLFTVNDVIRGGLSALALTRISPRRIDRIWQTCQKIAQRGICEKNRINSKIPSNQPRN
jgi:hypothetical protein